MKRTYVFKPYLGNHHPHFILSVWNTGRVDSMGKIQYGYSLTERHPALKAVIPGRSVVIFKGEDFYSPRGWTMVGVAEGIMGFLTLREGDTDPAYFTSYTPRQHDFKEDHAEAVYCEVAARWCDDTGALKKRYR